MANRNPNTVCDYCGEPIYRRPSTLERNDGKFCSRGCRNKAHPNEGEKGPNPKLQGENNPAWKGEHYEAVADARDAANSKKDSSNTEQH